MSRAGPPGLLQSTLQVPLANAFPPRPAPTYSIPRAV